MTTPPIPLPPSSPAGRPRNLGLPGPSWPPADFTYLDVFSDVFSDTFGILVITTTVAGLRGG